MLWYLIKKERRQIMKKRFGFTLAEVLITLGIIGVVAAMTIPTLIANTNSARFRSQFKKSVSTLAQAGLMGQAQYDFTYGDITDACGQNPDKEDPDTTMTFCSLFNGTLSGHVLSATAPTDKSGNAYTAGATLVTEGTMYLQMADGALLIFNGSATGCTKLVTEDLTAVDDSCIAYIDVNGTTLPNKVVACEDSTASLAAISGIELGTCLVPNDAQHMTDIFPIVFHDSTVEAAVPASRYILTTSK